MMEKAESGHMLGDPGIFSGFGLKRVSYPFRFLHAGLQDVAGQDLVGQKKHLP